MEEGMYPNWVNVSLVEDDLPWDKAVHLTKEEFCAKYTLHDSFWVGAFQNIGFNKNIILAFQWDAHWLPEHLKVENGVVEDWPYLFIKLEEALEITQENYEDIGNTSRAISDIEFETIEGAEYLAIDDVYGGQVNIKYTGPISFLAYSPDKTALNL